MEINSNPTEISRKAELETIIERGLQTFVEVGNAIREIRDSKLYKDEYGTFEEYCRERWGWSRRHTNRTIEAADTAAVVGPTGPKSERHARELGPLAREDPEEARELWAELSKSENLTAADIRQAVKERGEYRLYLDSLPPQTRATLEQADENDQKQRNVLRNSNQLDHLANIANKRGDEVAAEVAEKVLTEEGSSTFSAYEGMKSEPEQQGKAAGGFPELPDPNLTKEEKAYGKPSREWLALSRLDPEKVAARARSQADTRAAIEEADTIIGWFESYKAALRNRGRELEPGNLRRVQ